MTEATIRGVPGMKSVLDMPVMQVRDRIDDYILLLIFRCAQISLSSLFNFLVVCFAFRERGKNFVRAHKRDSIRKSLGRVNE